MRGANPCLRAAGHYIEDWRAHVAAQVGDIGIIALVEAADGVANIEAIARVRGLLALMVGPFDLSVSMGHAGDYLLEAVQAALARMLAAAEAADLPAVMPLFDPDPAAALRQKQRWQAQGIRLFVVGTGRIFFAGAVGRYARALSRVMGCGLSQSSVRNCPSPAGFSKCGRRSTVCNPRAIPCAPGPSSP